MLWWRLDELGCLRGEADGFLVGLVTFDELCHRLVDHSLTVALVQDPRALVEVDGTVEVFVVHYELDHVEELSWFKG